VLGSASTPPRALRAGAPSLLEGVLADADAAAWRWRGAAGGDELLPTVALARLAAATRGRWSERADGPPAVAPSALLRHATGRELRVLWQSDAVVICDAQAATCEQARLEPAELGALREALR